MSDDLDPVRRGDDFTEPAALDIAAGLDREVDDDRAGASSPTIASVSRIGALRPGMSAVQMTMSVRFRSGGDRLALAALILLAHLAGIASGGLRRIGRPLRRR